MNVHASYDMPQSMIQVPLPGIRWSPQCSRRWEMLQRSLFGVNLNQYYTKFIAY
jgi:hypothetical protein